MNGRTGTPDTVRSCTKERRALTAAKWGRQCRGGIIVWGYSYLSMGVARNPGTRALDDPEGVLEPWQWVRIALVFVIYWGMAWASWVQGKGPFTFSWCGWRLRGNFRWTMKVLVGYFGR
jgi:hypothetical protein